MKLILAFLFINIFSARASSPELPRLFFSYSWLHDSVVRQLNPPEAKWMDEIEVLFDRTGLGFSRKEMTASFSVCPRKPSYSDPLVLNMTV